MKHNKSGRLTKIYHGSKHATNMLQIFEALKIYEGICLTGLENLHLVCERRRRFLNSD